MSASLEMNFSMTKGTDEDFRAVLSVLRKIGGSNKETWWGLNEKNHSFTIGNSDFPAIWGDDYLETDPKPYVLFAKAAPRTEWTVSSERCCEVDGTESCDKAIYVNGVLNYEYLDFSSGRSLDYYELCDYVMDNCFDEEEWNEEDEEDDLSLEKLESCFTIIAPEVIELFDKPRKLKKAEFMTDADGSELSLYKPIRPTKLSYVIKEYFSNGKESEDLDGKTFVITGKLNYFDNRDAMAEYIENNGGNVAGSVSKKTAFLVCNDGDSTSSKAQKAAELGIPVITEGEFIGRFGFPSEYDEEE